MPNGTVEDRFNSYFLGKEFRYGVHGTSEEGSHPRVGARCYLLNKLGFTRSNSENLFCIVMKILGKIMKYLCVINKIALYSFFPQKIKSFSFGGLGGLFNSSLATKKPGFGS